MPYKNLDVRREYMRLYMKEYRKRERTAIREMRKTGFSTRIGGLARSVINSLHRLVAYKIRRNKRIGGK